MQEIFVMVEIADIFDQIISTLRPEHIPIEFILSATYKDIVGKTKIISRQKKLKHFMENPQEYHVMEASISLNVVLIRQTIHQAVSSFFDDLTASLEEIKI